MVGYCAIGRLRAAMPPASMMTMAMTQAKIGRSMKKRDSAMALAYGCWRLAPAGCGVTGMSGMHLLQALHDQLVAGLEAVQHLPVAAHGAAGLEHAQARDVLVVHHQGGGLALLRRG